MREDLLDVAERMVQDRGLNAVSFQHLADAVGLSKPSVFHHFPNKGALAQALLERCRTHYGEAYDGIVSDETGAVDKLNRIAALYAEGVESGQLCLLGVLGHGVATLPDETQQDLRLKIAGAVDRFSRVFEQGRREASLRFEGTPEAAAEAFLGMLQGLQILARAQGNPASVTAAAQIYIQAISA
ncbi:MAG: TetR/AcrR family transcriptional regulator [Planctomycetota bacterium]